MMIDLLETFDINAARNPDMPGGYVEGAKIASIGIRVRRGWTMHGVSLNVNMDLTPFSFINPCGVAKQKMIRICDFVPKITMDEVKARCNDEFIGRYLSERVPTS